MHRKDLGRLKEMKDEGHDLIDRIVKKKRIPKTRVYQLLQARRGKVLESSVHFANIFTLREAQENIDELKAMLRKAKPPPKQKYISRPASPDVLPLAEQKRILSEKPKPPRLTLLQKIFPRHILKRLRNVLQ